MWIPASGAPLEYADYPRTLEDMQAMWKRSRHRLCCKYKSDPSPGRAEIHCTSTLPSQFSVHHNPGKVTNTINSGWHKSLTEKLHQCRSEQHSTRYHQTWHGFCNSPAKEAGTSYRNSRERASSTHKVQGSNWDSQLWFPAGLAQKSSRGFF